MGPPGCEVHGCLRRSFPPPALADVLRAGWTTERDLTVASKSQRCHFVFNTAALDDTGFTTDATANRGKLTAVSPPTQARGDNAGEIVASELNIRKMNARCSAADAAGGRPL